MRQLQRNKQPLWWANYASKTENKDEYDNPDGTYTIIYTEPQKSKWNIGYVDSEAEVQAFGIQSVDTLRIVAEKKNFPLTTESILWYGVEPTAPHNYVVAGIRPSLNELVFYARKVDMTYAPKPEPPEEEEPEEPPEIEP